MNVTLPSGLSGEIRELIVADEDILADGAMSSDTDYFGLLEQMLERCWMKTTDPGPYRDVKKFSIEKLTPADSEWGIIQLRKKSWGDDFHIETVCPNGHDVAGVVKCSAVQVTKMSPEVADRFKRGEPEAVMLPSSGRKVEFHVMTRGLEKRIREAQETYPKERATHALLGRIVSVEGFDGAVPVDKESHKGLTEWLREMPSRDATVLRHAFSETDPVVDTDVTVACQCGSPAQENLLLCPDFFVPREMK